MTDWDSLTTDQKQLIYRDARFTQTYDAIWQTVGKCVFCDLREKYIFFEEHGVVMTISLYAYIDGHFMIVPRRHVRSPKDLTQLEWDTVRKFSYIAKKLIRNTHGIRGMQLVQKDGASAQGTVTEHVHFHCVPFDAPDLCEWNYRKLRYTPLENVALYKKARKKIIEVGTKYEQKYRQPSGLRIVCDAVMVNTKGQVLLQERPEHLKLSPDYLTLPGGGVEDFTATLESELAREVLEETGLDISGESLQLVDSRLGSLRMVRKSVHLDAAYTEPAQFMWNTYVVRGFDPQVELTPGDDCKELVWMDMAQAMKHKRVSPEAQEILGKITV